MKGRKPVPTEVKELRGTARADRMIKDEPEFPIPGRMPSPPASLREDGEKLWRALGKLLLDVGLFTAGDAIALEMLCIAYDRMIRANRQLETRDEVLLSENGFAYQNPWLQIANKAWDQVKGMLAEFGLTPAERTRVMAIVRDDDGEGSLAEQLFTMVKEAQNQGDKEQ